MPGRGELTTWRRGSTEVAERWRPLFEAWASVVILVGGEVGAAHAMKLINNLVSIGYAAIWSECYAMVKKLGAEPEVFREIVSNSGMNCGNFQAFSKYAVEGDASAHKFTLANCFKDMSYYEMATKARAATRCSTSADAEVRDGDGDGRAVHLRDGRRGQAAERDVA